MTAQVPRGVPPISMEVVDVKTGSSSALSGVRPGARMDIDGGLSPNLVTLNLDAEEGTLVLVGRTFSSHREKYPTSGRSSSSQPGRLEIGEVAGVGPVPFGGGAPPRGSESMDEVSLFKGPDAHSSAPERRENRRGNFRGNGDFPYWVGSQKCPEASVLDSAPGHHKFLNFRGLSIASIRARSQALFACDQFVLSLLT
jgi:hypothetical protein